MVFWSALFILFFLLNPVFAENLALKKVTNQSCTFGNKDSSLAVDGNQSTCSIAGVGSESEEFGWWSVDLGKIFEVEYLNITNNVKKYESRFLSNLEVNLSDEENSKRSLCTSHTDIVPRGTTLKLSCNEKVSGRFLKISKTGGFRQDALSLCEVEIFGKAIKTPFVNDDSETKNRNLPPNYKIVEIRPSNATHSHTFSTYDASLAIDLNPDTCSVAGVGSKSTEIAWFKADLGSTYHSIVSITMLNSPNSYESLYMSSFEVQLLQGSQHVVCYQTDSKVDAHTYFTATCDFDYFNKLQNNELSIEVPEKIESKKKVCDERLQGRFVFIKRLKGSFRQDALSICDLVVRVCVQGKSDDTANEFFNKTNVKSSLATSNSIHSSTPPTPHSTTSTSNPSKDLFRIFPVNFTQSSYSELYKGMYALDSDASTCAIMKRPIMDDKAAWFTADLGVSVEVNEILIVNSPYSDYIYLQNFSIFVTEKALTDQQVQLNLSVHHKTSNESYNLCSYFPSVVDPAKVMSLKCSNKDGKGQYVTIKKEGGFRKSALILCGLEILAAGLQPDLLTIKPVSISFSDPLSNSIPNYPGSALIDQLPNTCISTVSHTDGQAWIHAFFVLTHKFSKIIITNTANPTEYMHTHSLKFMVGSKNTPTEANEVCNYYNSSKAIGPGKNLTVNCLPLPLSGNFVTIQKISEKHSNLLSVCEVVFVVTTLVGVCAEGEFQCRNALACVDASKVCDGRHDCNDRSDEFNCPCPDGHFKCPSQDYCIPHSYRCDRQLDCTDGSDEYNCTCENLKCDGRCIDPRWMCDGFPDCSDASDEFNCPCKENEFRCVILGSCLSADKICDRIKHCPDQSDEINCTCTSNEYACENGTCITREWLCDGVKDCPNADDEASCTECARNEFTCLKSKKCINISKRCDGLNDCEDESDEEKCIFLKESTSNKTTLQALKANFKSQNDYFFCSHLWSTNISDLICQYMGHRKSIQTTKVLGKKVQSLNLQDSHIYTNPQVMSWFQKGECPTSTYIHMSCEQAECGKRKIESLFVPYIVNGVLASLGAWPWQAQLLYNDELLCGATIVQEKWLVTAAHCIMGAYGKMRSTFGMKIQVGSIKIDSASSTYYTIKQTIKHPSYNDTTYENDIALIEVDGKIEFTNVVQPICLPEFKPLKKPFYDLCVSTGFGKTIPTYTSSKHLMQGRMDIIPYNQCLINLAKQMGTSTAAIKSRIKDEIMICAGSQSKGFGINTCKGDSGGPLACRDSKGSWSLAGVISFGLENSYGTPCRNSVMMRVSAYVPFIQKYAFR